jgi:hypothetical protein
MASIFFSENYRESYNAPDMSTSAKEKQKPKYNLEMSRWLYSMYSRNQTEISSAYLTLIDTLRAYAEGRQSGDKYKSYFTGSKSTDTLDTDTFQHTNQYYRKGWMSLQDYWDNPISFVVTLLNAIRGALADNDYNIQAEPIDYDSGYEEDRLMHEIIVKAKFGKTLNSLYQMNGTPPPDDLDIPVEYDDLEEMKKDGLFKEPYVREHVQLLRDFFNCAQWDNVLRAKLLDDLMITGYAFSHEFYDKRSGKATAEYVDPQNLIIQYSDQFDFGDSDFAGFLRWVPISRIRACSDYIVNSKGEKIGDKELKDLAKTYSGQYTNTEYTGKSADPFKRDGTLEDMKVLEAVFYWRDVEAKKTDIEYVNKKGQKKRYPYDETVKKLSAGERVIEMKERKLYSCTWIVNSDWLYDYGLVPNQGYVENEPWLPIRGVKMEGKSLVHRLVPVADVFAISFLKFLNGLSKATEGGYAIDVTKLMISDPKKFNPLSVVKQFLEGNFFFYQSGGGMNVGGTPIPINMIPGNLREFIEPWIQQLQWCVSFAENLTGIPLMMLGSTPKPDTGLGVTEMSLQSATNSLRPYSDKMKKLKEDLATLASQMIQLAVKYDTRARDAYARVVGQANLYTLLKAKYLPIQYGIIMKARPDMQMRQAILQMAAQALEAGRNGQPGLTYDQTLYITEQVYSGTALAELRLTLKKWIYKDKIEKQKQQEKMVQLQAEQNQKMVQAQIQSAEKIEMMKQQTMKTQIDLETRSKMLVNTDQFKHDLDLMIAKYRMETEGAIAVNRDQAKVEADVAQP